MEEYFKPSDIVWVKLGPFWWPGEVVDKTKVPEEVTESLKKDPVAIVKFFDDDEYFECVKTPDFIYPYNCERKNGFIKKGMDAFRAKNPKLTSFPKDVSTAEAKTGGNVNILSDPMFNPERKRNYAAEIFGSPSPKKPKNTNRNRPNKSAPIITHRRFLGYDDYEARVLIQMPGKDKDCEGQDKEAQIFEEILAKFICPICQFVTDKLGILTVHTQCHVKEVAHIPGSPIKKTPKRKRKKGISDEEYGDDKKTKTKRKYKKKSKVAKSTFGDDERSGNDTSFTENDILRRKIEHTTSVEKKDVCTDIIADWDDESNQDTTEEIDVSVLDSTINETHTYIESTVNEASTTADSALDSTFEPTEEDKSNSNLLTEARDQIENLEKTEKRESIEEKKEKDTNISCFDFDENEEDTRIPDATSGRKIPRVIPISDKRKSFNFEDNAVEKEEEEIRKKILDESVQLDKVSETEEKNNETEDLEKTYKSLMDSTSKIELPEIPDLLKGEQNFHCAKTVKYPDKADKTTSDFTDGDIILEDLQTQMGAKENLVISEVDVPNIEKFSEGLKLSKVTTNSSIEQQCENLNKNPEGVSEVCSIIDVKAEYILENSKVIDNEPSIIKKIPKKWVEHKEIIIEDKLINAPNVTSSSKIKSSKIKDFPEDPVTIKEKSEDKLELTEVEEVIQSRKKRSRKSKVCLDDFIEKGFVENVEDSPCAEIAGNIMKIEQKPNDKLNDPPEIEQPQCEEKFVEDYEKKNKRKSKREIGRKKEKKDKKSVFKRPIDESEIDKLLAKYSVDPIKDDDESDYCSSELVTVQDVLVDNSSILSSASLNQGVLVKSDEIKQQVSETKVTSSEESDVINRLDDKTVIEPEHQSLNTDLSDSNNSEKNEVNLKEHLFEIAKNPTEMEIMDNCKLAESAIDNEQVKISEVSCINDLISDVCMKEIESEVELKKQLEAEKEARIELKKEFEVEKETKIEPKKDSKVELKRELEVEKETKIEPRKELDIEKETKVELKKEFDLKKVNKKKSVSKREKISRRSSSKRHKSSSQYNEQEDHVVTSSITFESGTDVDSNAIEGNKKKKDHREHDSQIAASINSTQIYEICKEEATIVERATQEVQASVSSESKETSSLVVVDEKEPRQSAKIDRRSIKEHNKVSSQYEPFSDIKKETDAPFTSRKSTKSDVPVSSRKSTKSDAPVSSRRSTRWDRKSTDKDITITGQATTSDKKEKSETEIINYGISNRDESNSSEKEEKIEKTDPRQSHTIVGDPEEVSSSSSKNSKKGDKNDKDGRDISKNQSLRNEDTGVSDRKESHKSPHKSSRSSKRSSKSARDTKSSTRKHDSVDDVTLVIDQQLQEIGVSHRSSRSKIHNVDQDVSKKNEYNALLDTNEHISHVSFPGEMSKNIKSNKGDHQVFGLDKQKEKETATDQKEDRKSSHTSRSNRRSSKHDHEHQESFKESCTARNEHLKTDDKKDSSSQRRSKSERCSNKNLDKSSNSKVIQSVETEESSLEVTQGSSSHRSYRRSRDHSEKHKNDPFQSNKIILRNEKELKATSLRTYRSGNSSKNDRQDEFKSGSSPKNERQYEFKSGSSWTNERQDEFKHISALEVAEENLGIDRSFIKDALSGDDYSEKENESKIIVNQKIDESSSYCGIDRVSESNNDKENEALFMDLAASQEKHEISHSMEQTENEGANKSQEHSDEKQDKLIVCPENDKCIASKNIASSEDNDSKLKTTMQLDAATRSEEIIFDDKPTNSKLPGEENNVISQVKNELSIEASSFSPISSGDQDLTNLISTIVGGDSTHELDDFKKSDRNEDFSDPTSDSSNQVSFGNKTKENKHSNDVVCQLTSICESREKVYIDPTTDVLPISILSEKTKSTAEHKQDLSLPASQSSRRNRKPSRWDQKERLTTSIDKKPRISRWDQCSQENINEQKSNISDIIEKLEIMNNIEKSSIVPHPEADLHSENEQLDDKIIVSPNEERSVVSLREAEQIELIFGSSPLPKPSDDNLFTEEGEEDKKSQTFDSNDFSEKKDVMKTMIMKSKESEPTTLSEEKNKETSTTFECSSIHLSLESSHDDLMESVESQVARITHYEEPYSEEKQEVLSNEFTIQRKKESLFDTPEKENKNSSSIFDTPNDKVKVDSETPERKLPLEKKKLRLLEKNLGMQKPETTEEEPKQEKIAPKSKKNYLLVEKSKLEKMEKAPEPLKDLSLQSESPSSSKSSTEKVGSVNEVATKLTNPKKRFVKSFKDFELNKQKEKSAGVSPPVENNETKTTTVSGLVGKSPIVFKLKKQFLSKISNVFDEENEDISKGNNSTTKTKSSMIGPSTSPKVRGLNFLLKGEDILNDAESDNMKSMPKKEIQVEDKKTSFSSDEPSRPDNSNLSEFLSQDSHQREEPEVEPMGHLDKNPDLENKDPIKADDNSTPKSSSHKVHFTTDINSPIEFSIDTNLTNIDKPEELSELAELVNVAVVQSDVVKKVEEETHVDDSKTEIITKNFPLENKKEEPELVPIDGNLTVVSEKELEEGQIEITASMSNKKPLSLMNFSMDFSDDSSDTSFEVLKKENIRSITESLDVTKNSEDEFKDQLEDDMKTQLTGKTLSESPITNMEATLQNAIIAQLDLNFDNSNSVQKGDHPIITMENILGTKEMKKNEAEQNVLLNDSLSTVNETTTFAKTVCRVSDLFSTKEPEKSGSVSPAKRNERKMSQKTKLITQSENEPVVIYNTVKSSTITDMCDLEDHIPSQIVCTKNALINEQVMKVAGIGNELTKEGSLPKIEPPISKLFSRLAGDKKEETPKAKTAELELRKKDIDTKNLKMETSGAKNSTKSSVKGTNTLAQNLVSISSSKSGNKAIILSEKIIRPARDAASSNLSLKRSYEDVEDIKPYIITKNQKIDKKGPEKPITPVSKLTSPSMKSPNNTPAKLLLTNPNKQTMGVPKFSGKAKILNQTIIRPAGETPQAKAVPSVEDNVDFDINSMPIVLSDELLTAECLENMPIVLGDNIPKTSATEKLKIIVDKKDLHSTAKILNNSVTMPSLVHSPTLKMPQLKKTSVPKILQSSGQKIIRQATTKPGKYIILPENPNKSVQLMKKPNIVRRSLPISGVAATSQNITQETTGHKIMIVTNQQGQQQRLLLTPAHQKMFGMQLPKVGKTMVKSAITQKTTVGKVLTTTSSSLTSASKVQGISSPKFIKAPVSSGQILSPQLKLAPPRKVQKVFMPSQQTAKIPQQKTILIRNQHGQTVRKIQGTDDALLDKQVAEQLEAIKVSSLKSQQKQQELTIKTTNVNKPSAFASRKAYPKRPEYKQTVITQPKLTTTNVGSVSKSSEQSIPPLLPIKLDMKTDETQRHIPDVKSVENKPLDRPLNQLVIQDNMGNQTTVTEGQILALPSETVDGQPQSYMLVTLDESGNLTPLNNEALMSLDPSLAGLTGGDLSNMVLQLDPGITKDAGSHTAQLQAIAPLTHIQEKFKPTETETSKTVNQEVPLKPIEQPVEQATAQVQVTCNINGEPSQQIILTGDPLATQKFLDSLSEGNTDLANILANAEGSSFLIQADGQQILINTEPTNAQMLQANTNVAEQPDRGNPMFSTHPIKNQDILAAALADTDVFQQEQLSNQNKVMHSQLSPGQTLFPMNVGNVLETSLTLNSPIMTPLEVPSTNSKKITDAEADILTARVPKNVDLPITITDPNISQTVSHQQVLMASDLQTNLELTLPISETAMSVTSGMNSPSFVYSLPSLDVGEHTEVSQKSFSSSMPLLTEDIEETLPSPLAAISKGSNKSIDNKLSVGEVSKHSLVESLSGRRPGIITSDGTFLEEGLCTLGGEMCSSLSEPPPEMFDIPISNDGLNFLSNKAEGGCKENSNSTSALAPELLTDDNSMEIPVQPQIVADLKDPPHREDSLNSATDEKECKLN